MKRLILAVLAAFVLTAPVAWAGPCGFKKDAAAFSDTYLEEANNLSDLDSAATAITNLGLGPLDSVTFLDLTVTSGDADTFTVTTFSMTAGTSTTFTTTNLVLDGNTASAFFKTLVDDADASTARGTLGLDAAALEPLSTFYQVANNFTECTPTTALTNLGFSAFLKTLIGAADAATFYTGIVQAGTADDSGALKLASTAEAVLGADAAKAVTSAGVAAAITAAAVPDPATYTDVNTATEAAEYIAPDQLALSKIGIKTLLVPVVGMDTANSGGEKDEYGVTWPFWYGTMYLAGAEARSNTASTNTETVTVQIVRRQLDTNEDNAFSTALTIDDTEVSSTTAAAAVAIAAGFTVTTGDFLYGNVVTAGDGSGLEVLLKLQLVAP